MQFYLPDPRPECDLEELWQVEEDGEGHHGDDEATHSDKKQINWIRTGSFSWQLKLKAKLLTRGQFASRPNFIPPITRRLSCFCPAFETFRTFVKMLCVSLPPPRVPRADQVVVLDRVPNGAVPLHGQHHSHVDAAAQNHVVELNA